MVPVKHTFPPSFFSEEDRLGFHIDRKRKELWAIELDMLYELDRVCKKLNVQYFLEAGTLLGAARDGRFIPWDDDIDVSMLRPDYDRFVREAPREFKEPYFLQTGYTEENYYRGHSQLRRSDTCAILPEDLKVKGKNQGVFLDIFVLDELFPERLEAQFQKRAALLRRKKIWNHHDYHPNPLRYAARWTRYLLYHLRYPRSAVFYRQLEAIFRSPDKSDYVDSLFFFSRPEQTHCFPRAWLDETVELPFEGGVFPAPQGYRAYLAMYYGDDWETPRQTPSVHGANGGLILDLDRSYRDVLREANTRS